MSVLTDANGSQDIQAQSYVGFDCESLLLHQECRATQSTYLISRFTSAITKQIEHKLLKRGFRFNVMLVGK